MLWLHVVLIFVINTFSEDRQRKNVIILASPMLPNIRKSFTATVAQLSGKSSLVVIPPKFLTSHSHLWLLSNVGLICLSTASEKPVLCSIQLATLMFLHLLQVLKGQLILVYFDVSSAVITVSHSLVLYKISYFLRSWDYITAINFITIWPTDTLHWLVPLVPLLVTGLWSLVFHNGFLHVFYS